MPTCSVFCCKKKSGTSSFLKDGVTFHVFPKDPILKDIWKKFCNARKTWIPAVTSVICSDHFKASDFQMMGDKRRRLNQTAIPTLIPHCTCYSHPLSTDSSTLPIPELPSESLTLEQSKSSNIISQTNAEAPLSPRKRKMQEKINWQKIKIKRLQSKNLYLKKKVAGLEKSIRDLNANLKLTKKKGCF